MSKRGEGWRPAIAAVSKQRARTSAKAPLSTVQAVRALTVVREPAEPAGNRPAVNHGTRNTSASPGSVVSAPRSAARRNLARITTSALKS